MTYPPFDDLNCSNCTERSIRIHYPDFYCFLYQNYPDLTWGEKLYWFYNQIVEQPKCRCGNHTNFINFKKGYREFCCYACMNKGVQHRREQTFIHKYGTNNPMKVESFRERLKQTNIKKFGVDNAFKSDEIKRKIKETHLIKRGTDHHMKTGESVIKMLNTRNNIIINEHPEIISINDEHLYKIKCPHPECESCTEKWYEISSSIWYDRSRLGSEMCTRLSPVGQCIRRTSLEIFITKLLDELKVDYITNARDIIPPKELDIYIPDKNIAIECNGIYWHNSSMKSDSYHENKFKLCQERGIQLMTLWEDWIINKPDIIKSIIKAKLGYCETLYARKCIIKEIDVKTANLFLSTNHIQGKCSGKIRLGLYYNEELVSVMLFGTRQTMSKKIKGEWDLLRFCNKLNCCVVGGADKLLKCFIEKYLPNTIYSFSSNDISNGNLYSKLGFEKGPVNQSYWYIESGTMRRYHRSSFTKDSIIKKGWKESKEGWTEREVMLEHGYYQIYDSGQTKWILRA